MALSALFRSDELFAGHFVARAELGKSSGLLLGERHTA